MLYTYIINMNFVYDTILREAHYNMKLKIEPRDFPVYLKWMLPNYYKISKVNLLKTSLSA